MLSSRMHATLVFTVLLLYLPAAHPLAVATGRVPLAAARPSTTAWRTPLRVRMAEEDGGDGGREGERQRGRTAVIARPKPVTKERSKEEVENEPSWRVLLHNDDVHTFDYVTMAIVQVVKTITRKKAHRITVQCHSMGTATVTTTWKQMAKTYCLKLQKYGLTSSIAPDGQGGNST
jgi:ATP-dependent Clp protease adapter protein ClpS